MKFYVDVTQHIEVTLDETKFTPEMMNDFKRTFYPFIDIDEHAQHIGSLEARGLIHTSDSQCFIEGYGDAEAMGIKAHIQSTESEVRRACTPHTGGG